ncbi:MAG TPA: glycosyltransferase [Phycisphaerales bacterium]|nr:glycosyltransferase [Phycisphaerales bacterium]
MKIAQVATSSGPVRQDQTGSVESLVWLLTRELIALGHQVTVFGCGGAEVPAGAEFVRTHPGAYGMPGTPSDWQVCDWMTLAQAVGESHRFDVIHSHAYLWGLPLQPLSHCPMVHTLHTTPYDDEELLAARFPDAAIVGVSHFQWSSRRLTPTGVVYHGVDPTAFTFRRESGGYLCYLGRFIAGKGPLEAIRVAKELAMPIMLAGPRNEYFDEHIACRIDGEAVRYAGAVDRAERDALLGGAAALLYPLSEPEPFGLVQVEAMMCGTPVVATRTGATPEVIDNGTTGVLVSSHAELARAVALALRLPRELVRARAKERFTARRMATEYAAIYGRLHEPAAART